MNVEDHVHERMTITGGIKASMTEMTSIIGLKR